MREIAELRRTIAVADGEYTEGAIHDADRVRQALLAGMCDHQARLARRRIFRNAGEEPIGGDA